MNILEVCSFFKINGEACAYVPYGNGHINDTYLITAKNGGKTTRYILQRINNYVFKNIPQLMSNIEKVTEWQRREIENENGNPLRETLCLVPTIEDTFYVKIDENNYRMYYFIENSISLDRPRNREDFAQSAVIYAKFMQRLDAFDTDILYTTIPDFHNTPKRIEDLYLAAKKDKAGRLKAVEKEMKWIEERVKFSSLIISLLSSKAIPTRVTHNDMKLNNVLLDDNTGKGLAVIDLDTIMPGSLVYDFGDAIRFGCNTAAENEPDTLKVEFNIEMYKTYAKTFIEVMDGYITDLEKKHLLFGSCLMTYECGVRFLSDYLNGDLYFKTSHSEENLHRARTQFKLVEGMESVFYDLTDWTFKL